MKQKIFGSLVVGIATLMSLLQPSLAQRTPTIGIPDGYFVYRNTLYAVSGGSICGFLNPGHAQIFRGNYTAPDKKVTNFSSYRDFGACALPATYFDFNKTVYYSSGDGKVCGFLSQDALNNYRNYYRTTNVGSIKTFPPKEVATNIGECPPP